MVYRWVDKSLPDLDFPSSKVQRAETINDMFKPRVDAPHEALGGPPKPKKKKRKK